MKTLLETLVHLDPVALHARAGAAARRQAAAAWELAACLVAMEKSEYFREFACASVVEYAERHLGLGPYKTLELLRGGRVLERFSKLSEACREGRLCWSKLREIGRAVEPETEEKWLAFALAHTTREVERAVSVSAGQYRREAAAGGRVDGGGASGDGGVSLSEAAADTPVAFGAIVASASIFAPPPRPASQPAKPPAPAPPSFVRVELHLTPDQFAIWDAAVDRVRSQRGRRVAKEIALEVLARHFLAGGDSRTRTNHPVVLRADPATGSTCWYETSRGVLPASKEAVEDALARERGTFVAIENVADGEMPVMAEIPESLAKSETVVGAEAATAEPEPVSESEADVDTFADGQAPPRELEADAMDGTLPSTSEAAKGAGRGRRAMPAMRRRAALARAGYRCERCGATARLEVDHVTPVCDGGADLGLQVLCHDCHALKHAADVAGDPRYAWARAETAALRQQRKEAASSKRVPT